MIVPNLLVQDLARSVAFYRDLLGFETMMVLSADNTMIDNPADPEAVFATLAWRTHQLMLQTERHLSQSGAPQLEAAPGLSGSFYLRDFPWDAIKDRLPPGALLGGPVLQWYGMAEIIVQDPDGYTLVLGRREGPPPTA